MQSATHFVDLMRFLGGDIVKGSISAVRVGPEAILCDLPEKSEQKATKPSDVCASGATSFCTYLDQADAMFAYAVGDPKRFDGKLHGSSPTWVMSLC